MSWRTLPVSVRSSMTRRQLRTAVSPAGVHASLPLSQRELFCQATLRTRSSLVLRRTLDPAWGAFGGGVQARIASGVEVLVTVVTPGTPLILSRVRVPVAGECIAR